MTITDRDTVPASVTQDLEALSHLGPEPTVQYRHARSAARSRLLPRPWRRRRPRQISPRLALLQFAAAGVLALVLLGVIGLTTLRNVAVHQAISEATVFVAGRAERKLAPVLTDALVAGQPTALAKVDRIVREQLLSDRVVRVKLWTVEGRIVYSDEPRLIDAVFPLSARDLAALNSGNPTAQLSNLTDPENKYERSFGRLLQIYDGVQTVGGTPMLLEVYLRFDGVAANANALGREVAPAFLLALLALQVLQLPLAWRLVRRIGDGHREREALSRRAIEASDHERRRIARDLHDGVVQSLAGLSYTLTAVGAELDRGATPSLGTAVSDAARATRANIAQLRTLIFEINPPSLQRLGLSAALHELAASLTDAGIEATLTIPPQLPIAPDRAAAFYRAAQEAVRNIITHSGARNVEIAVEQVAGAVQLTVADNGVGFRVEPGRGAHPEYHFGLTLLEDLARDVGGWLQVESSLGRGTTLTFTLPQS